MKKKVTKNTKSRASSTKGRKGVRNGLYATEHDFIIITGGGLVVLLLTFFLFWLS